MQVRNLVINKPRKRIVGPYAIGVSIEPPLDSCKLAIHVETPGYDNQIIASHLSMELPLRDLGLVRAPVDITHLDTLHVVTLNLVIPPEEHHPLSNRQPVTRVGNIVQYIADVLGSSVQNQ